MAKENNIVHNYFSKQTTEGKLLVKVNPVHHKGIEILVHPDGSCSARELEFDENILEDLKVDGFTEANPLEFNLYLSGLA